jgi:hypothetical protein
VNRAWFADILPLMAILIAIGIPFAIEKYWFRKHVGPFQFMFWIFVAQCSAIALGLLIVNLFGVESTLGRIGQAVGGFGFIAIGVIPFILLPIALVVALAIVGWNWLRHKRA